MLRLQIEKFLKQITESKQDFDNSKKMYSKFHWEIFKTGESIKTRFWQQWKYENKKLFSKFQKILIKNLKVTAKIVYMLQDKNLEFKLRNFQNGLINQNKTLIIVKVWK